MGDVSSMGRVPRCTPPYPPSRHAYQGTKAEGELVAEHGPVAKGVRGMGACDARSFACPLPVPPGLDKRGHQGKSHCDQRSDGLDGYGLVGSTVMFRG